MGRSTCSNQGYITEALNAVTQYAFKQLKVKRLAITCDPDNIRSQRVPKRLGFCLEGTLKFNRKKPITEEISDTLVYARYDLANLLTLEVSWK